MADFDIVSKYLMQHYPDDFARFALGRDDVEGAEVIDPEQPPDCLAGMSLLSGLVEDLLDVLEIRFALGAAEPLVVRIRGIEDLQRLKQLHRAAHPSRKSGGIPGPPRR